MSASQPTLNTHFLWFYFYRNENYNYFYKKKEKKTETIKGIVHTNEHFVIIYHHKDIMKSVKN